MTLQTRYLSLEYKLQKNPYYGNIDDDSKDKLSNDNLQDQDNNSVTLDDIGNETDSIIELNSDEEIELAADESQKQAAYYEQGCYQRGTIKTMSAAELNKTCNTILSNYETCTEQMKLVVNSITLGCILNEIKYFC